MQNLEKRSLEIKAPPDSAEQVEELIKGALIRWDGKKPLDLKKILKWLSMDRIPQN